MIAAIRCSVFMQEGERPYGPWGYAGPAGEQYNPNRRRPVMLEWADRAEAVIDAWRHQTEEQRTETSLEIVRDNLDRYPTPLQAAAV